MLCSKESTVCAHVICSITPYWTISIFWICMQHERAMWITEIWSERIIQFTFTIHSYTVSTLNSIEFYLIIDSMAPIISLDTDVKFYTHFQRISIHMVDSHSILFFLFSLSKTFWCFHCLVCSDSTHDRQESDLHSCSILQNPKQNKTICITLSD